MEGHLTLSRIYDICSYLSQSEDIRPLFVKTDFMGGLAFKTVPRIRQIALRQM